MKKTLLSLFIFLIGIILSGCVSSGITTETMFYENPNKNLSPTYVSIPKLNTITKVEIGENMYNKYKKFETDTYKVFLKNERSLGYLYTDRITKSKKIACKNHICYIDNNNDFMFDEMESNNKIIKLTEKIPYIIKEDEPIYKEDSFKIIALYQGKKDNTIKISFREFKDNMARPAFTQDIIYDLDKNGNALIGFKGLRIEVLEATNFDITYKVIKDFN